MPITDLLERNSKLYGNDVALVEIDPQITEAQRVTWKEYELVQPTHREFYRRQITWSVFDEKANRVANLLMSRGIQKGQKVGADVADLSVVGDLVPAGVEADDEAGLILGGLVHDAGGGVGAERLGGEGC